jgi:hypothetical protein
MHTVSDHTECTFIIAPPSVSLNHIIPYELAAAAVSLTLSWFAVLRFFISPCLPPCFLISTHPTTFPIPSCRLTYRPLCKPQLRLSTALSNDTFFILKGTAHDARCDGEVAVVALPTISFGTPAGLLLNAMLGRPGECKWGGC